MSLLSYNVLVALVETGVIENCPLELVNGASIDVTLADKILEERFSSTVPASVDFRKRVPLPMYERQIYEHGYDLQPGEFILAASQQIFNLPTDIAAEYKLKSSMARIGLNHLNAGWADPTWHGSALTLELVNCSRYHSIRLRPGDRIGQVVFFRCAPVPVEASYAQRGRYNGDAAVTPIKK